MQDRSEKQLSAWFRDPDVPPRGPEGGNDGEYLTPKAFFARVCHFLDLGKIFVFREYPGERVIGENRYVYDDLFSLFAFNAFNVAMFAEEEAVYDAYQCKPVACALMAAIEEMTRHEKVFSIISDYRGNVFYDHVSHYFRNCDANCENSSLKESLEEEREMVQFIQGFASIFGSDDDLVYMTKPLKDLANRIDHICSQILSVNEPAEDSRDTAFYKLLSTHITLDGDLGDKGVSDLDRLFCSLGTLLSFAGSRFLGTEDLDLKCRLLGENLCNVFRKYSKNPMIVKGFSDIHVVIWQLLQKNRFSKLNDDQKERVRNFYHSAIYFGGSLQKLFEFDSSHVLNCYSGFDSCLPWLRKKVERDIRSFLPDNIKEPSLNLADADEWMKDCIKKRSNGEKIDITSLPEGIWPSNLSQEDFDSHGYFDEYKNGGFIDVEGALKNTQLFENKILETSYYLMEFHRYSPLFRGMEYTPILVNHFKAVEILISDFASKLGLDKIRVNVNGRGSLSLATYLDYLYKARTAKEESKISLDKDGWDERTIGNLKILVFELNEYCGSIPLKLNGMDVTRRLTSYNAEMERRGWRRFLSDQMRAFRDKYKRQDLFMNVFDPKASLLLDDLLFAWKDYCRNGNLHNHLTKDTGKNESGMKAARKIEFNFDFTNLVLSALIQWYHLISKEYSK